MANDGGAIFDQLQIRFTGKVLAVELQFKISVLVAKFLASHPLRASSQSFTCLFDLARRIAFF